MRSILISLLALLATACASLRVADPVFVEVRNGGALFIGDKPTSLDRLETDIEAALSGHAPNEKRVYVRASREVTYGEFMGLMNKLQDLGHWSVALIGEDTE